MSQTSAQLIMSEAGETSKQQVADYVVHVITWNVGGCSPDNITLHKLLNLCLPPSDGYKVPDIYAIGLQEVNADLKQQMRNIFVEDPWTEKVSSLLSQNDYVLVQTEQMQALLLSLWIKRCHVEHLRDIETEFTRTGFGGMWGNKGAVSIRLNLYGCGLVFVMSHLAAHDEHLDKRIEDYKQIMEKHHYHVKRFREIYDHDYVWWFGDLNFRLSGKDAPTAVRDAVLRGECAKLFERDQLTYVREQTQEAFQLLHEQVPTFPPTFKFKPGTDEYNMKRRPAWTDRIMYAVQPINRQPNMPLSIEQHSYEWHPAYTISDHRPVSSIFTIKLYPNYRVCCVIFTPIDEWIMDRENTITYTKPVDFEEYKCDWIGLFRVHYDSLRDYAGYEYVSKPESASSSMEDEQVPGVDLPPRVHRMHHRRHHHHHNHREHVRRERIAEREQVHLDFAEDLDLIEGAYYKLIYFQSTSSIRGVCGIAGMSNEFRAVKHERSNSPQH